MSGNERLIGLVMKHKQVMENKNIIVQVYTNASGFLWSMAMVDSGTDLGWSGFSGNCKNSGTFLTYEDALEDALNLIDKCNLETFRESTGEGSFHWGKYARFLISNYNSKQNFPSK